MTTISITYTCKYKNEKKTKKPRITVPVCPPIFGNVHQNGTITANFDPMGWSFLGAIDYCTRNRGNIAHRDYLIQRKGLLRK